MDAEEATLLLKHGAHVSATNGEGETPLHRAAVHGYFPLLHFLLPLSTPVVNLQTRRGLTALHLLCQHFDQRSNTGELWDSVGLLLARGANATILTAAGKSARDVLPEQHRAQFDTLLARRW